MKHIFILSTIFLSLLLWYNWGFASDWATANISKNTPIWKTVWSNSSQHVLSLDISSWEQDISISWLEIKRRWLSDEHALSWISVFYKNNKMSDSKDDNQWNDDRANINFDTIITIPENTTITLAIVATIPSIELVPEVQNQNFFLEVSDIISKNEIKFNRVAGNNFRIWWVDEFIWKIDIDQPESNIRLGTTRMIWEFDIKWNETRDSYVEFIRFTTDYNELEHDFSEVRLVYENKIIALWEIYNDEDIIFELTDNLFIESDKNITLKILARVQSRVSESFELEIEWNEDIVWTNSSGDIISGYIYQEPQYNSTQKITTKTHYSTKAQQISVAIEKIIQDKPVHQQHQLREKIIKALQQYKTKKPQHNQIISEVIEIISM